MKIDGEARSTTAVVNRSGALDVDAPAHHNNRAGGGGATCGRDMIEDIGYPRFSNRRNQGFEKTDSSPIATNVSFSAINGDWPSLSVRFSRCAVVCSRSCATIRFHAEIIKRSSSFPNLACKCRRR